MHLPQDRGSEEQILRGQAKPGTAWSAGGWRCARPSVVAVAIAKERG